ncbi:hypothetical protein SLA2020_386110 [Shorea laevis]
MYCHFNIQGTLKKAKKWSELGNKDDVLQLVGQSQNNGLHLLLGWHDIMVRTMNLPPSDEPCREWSFEKFVKLDEPRMTEIIKLEKENLIPGVNVIMIGIRSIMMFRGLEE